MAGHKILVFGCSTGEEAMTVALLFPESIIVGVDVDEETLGTARQLALDSSVSDRTFFFNSLVYPIHLLGKYDIIFSNSVLCNFPTKPNNGGYTFDIFESTVTILHRVLQPGGAWCAVNTNYRLLDTAVGAKFYSSYTLPPTTKPAFISLGNEDLKNKLMETELLLAEQCELIISEFELRYGNLRVKSADIMEKYFRGAEDAENGYFEMVSSLVEELVELSNKDELEDITEECRLLLADKESLNTHVAAAHDTHLSKLLGVEEELRDRVTNQTAACFKAYRDAEWKRNRHAVLDIRGIVEDNYDAIEKFMREFNEDSAEMD